MRCVYMCIILCVCKSLSCVWLFVTPMDSSLPGSSGDGILQARIWEWVAIPFSRGSSLPRNQTHVSHIASRFFVVWATREHSHKKWNVQTACSIPESNKILYLNSVWIKIKLAMLLLYIVMFLTLDTNNLQSNHEIPVLKDSYFCKIVFIVTLSHLMAK